MTESSQVYWGTVNSWTKLIGWIEVVWSVILIILVIIVSITVILVGPAKYQEIIENSDNPDSELFKRYGFGLAVAAMVTQMVMCIVHLGMGIILLKGVNERNPRYVKTYLIYLIICLCYKLITRFILFNMTTPSTVHQEISAVLHLIALVMFIFWVVSEFKKELEMDSTGGKGVVYKS